MQEFKMKVKGNIQIHKKLKLIKSGQLICKYKEVGICIDDCQKCTPYNCDVKRNQLRAKIKNETIERLKAKYGSK